MPALPGEPQMRLAVERRGVEVGVGAGLRQRPGLHRLGGGIDADDGVQAAIGDPGGAVRPDDHAMGARALAQRDALDLAGLGVKPPKRAGVLAVYQTVPSGAGATSWG